jgi:hypothetical protein
MLRSCIALLVGAMALTGCTDDANDRREAASPGGGVRLNLADPGMPQLAAGDPLRYVLNMTKGRCLWAATEAAGPPQPRIDVVWPAGTAAERGDDGAVRIVAEDGTVLAQVGGGCEARRRLSAVRGLVVVADAGRS